MDLQYRSIIRYLFEGVGVSQTLGGAVAATVPVVLFRFIARRVLFNTADVSLITSLRHTEGSKVSPPFKPTVT